MTGPAKPAAAPADAPLAAVAAMGVVLSGYLAYAAATDTRALCPVGAGCDLVLTSRYSSLFGLPLPLLGLAFYWTLLGVAVWPMDAARRARAALSVAAAGAGASAVFVVIQIAVIRALCSLCAISTILSVGALILAARSAPRLPRTATLRAAGAAIAAIAIVASGYLTVPRPQTPASGQAYAEGIARHLSGSGAKFYGAYWCPHCQDQKDIFGAAAPLLPYVECDPRSPAAQAQVCRAKAIRSYPTWEINGQRREGVQSLDELARLSGYQAPP